MQQRRLVGGVFESLGAINDIDVTCRMRNIDGLAANHGIAAISVFDVIATVGTIGDVATIGGCGGNGSIISMGRLAPIRSFATIAHLAASSNLRWFANPCFFCHIYGCGKRFGLGAWHCTAAGVAKC